jgi:hypothetical protein
MLSSYRKLALKLAVLCLLAGGVFAVQRPVSARMYCGLCPENNHCDFETNACVCNCLDPWTGGCPSTCP